MLTQSDRRRFARQLLLPEVGRAGQERLAAARLQVPPGADPESAAVALDYLRRAGVGTAVPAAPEATPVPLPTRARIEAVAGCAALGDVAAALMGAFAAVETFKVITGAGRPQLFPGDFVINLEPTKGKPTDDA